MKLIAQQLPDFKKILDCNPVNPKGCPDATSKLPGAPNFANLGDFLSGLLNIVFYIAIFLAFYWLVWGAWQYIFAGGEKENLSKARDKIKWAIIGLLVTIMAYTIAKFAGEIFPPGPGRGGLSF